MNGRWRQRTSRWRGGFSLVEVLVVLVVIGLLTTLAAVSFQGTRRVLDGARLQQTLAAFDQRVRHRAWLNGHRRQVVLDLDRAEWFEGPVDGPTTQPLRWSKASGDAGIAEAWTPATGWVRSGRLSWLCSAEGEVPTYALRLRKGQRVGGKAEPESWVIVGISGQWQPLNGEGGVGEWVLDTLHTGQEG